MHMPRKASGDRWRATRPPAGRQPSRRRYFPRSRHLTTPRTRSEETSISTETVTETPARARTPSPARCAQQLRPKQQQQHPTSGAGSTRHPQSASAGEAQLEASLRRLPKRHPRRAWHPPRAPAACSRCADHWRRHVPRVLQRPIRGRAAAASGSPLSAPLPASLGSWRPSSPAAPRSRRACDVCGAWSKKMQHQHRSRVWEPRAWQHLCHPAHARLKKRRDWPQAVEPPR